MASLLTQFYLLQYKNWKLQFRRKWITIFEILIPIFLCLLMIAVRTLVKVDVYKDPTYFPAYNVEKLSENLTGTFVTPFIMLAYTPNNSVTRSLVENVARKLNLLSTGFQTEKDLVESLTESVTNENLYLAGIVFENPDDYSTGIPKNITYTIRPRYTPRVENQSLAQSQNSWLTQYLYPPFQLPGPRDKSRNEGAKPDYYSEGFLALQRSLHKSVIEYLNPNITDDVEKFNLTMERFPYPPYKYDLFLSVVVQTQLPFVLVLSTVLIALIIPKEVVLEKESKLKESMKMMGMSNWLQWLAWFVKYLLFLAITTFLMALILCPPFDIPDDYEVLSYTDFSLLWVFLLLWAISIISFSFMISAFFKTANAAAAAGGILFFCLYIVFSFLFNQYDKMSLAMKIVSCLDMNVAMAFGITVIGKFEGAGTGAQWNKLTEPVTVDDNLPLGYVMLMFVVDSIMYFIIMWYVEAVFPGNYGIPQKPYFFLLPSYWCGMKQTRKGSFSRFVSREDDVQGYFESDPRNLHAGIELQRLTKTFKGDSGKKVAVNKLELNMYEGQITALLGHNGAGKTTTMFMLTGFIPPSGGTAIVNGYDITKDITSVRSSLGLCPQHDILFDNLTVEEHLFFFAKLKGCPDDKIQEQIDYYLKTLGIEEKRKAFAKTLSGGQKRKLSVGIALIGDSKIVILDEPTSGMDPSARRHMWDVLQSQRAGRTILLSTHFMDEADALGDRIAIMAEGVIQCCGSSLFLKKKYGAGYHMIMTKAPGCDVSRVTELLESHVPEAKLESDIAAELSFVLPNERVSAFPDLFSALEEQKDELGILGFGASLTTMEEVFMKVGEVSNNPEKMVPAVSGQSSTDEYAKFSDDESEESLAVDMDQYSPNLTSVVHQTEKNEGVHLFFQQFGAMILKRILYTLRNKVLTLSQILLPLVFTALTIGILKTVPRENGIARKVPLNVELYGKTQELYSSGLPGTVSDDVSKLYPKLFNSALEKPILVSQPREEIIEIAKHSLKDYNFELLFAADFNSTNSNHTSDVNVLFNAQPYHAAPAALLYTDTAILQHFVNSSYTFSAYNHPLPQTTSSKILEKAQGVISGDSFAYSGNMMFGFSFLASSFVVFLITERSRKIKHSQIVSGVKWYNFWLSTYLWDFINYLIPALLTVSLFAIADVKNLSDISNGNTQPFNLILLMIMFGLAVLPQMYVLQFLFTQAASGYVWITILNILSGSFPQLIVFILSALKDTKDVAKALDWVFLVILPNYGMGTGISNLYNNYNYIDLCFKEFPDMFKQQFHQDVTLQKICDGFEQKNMTFPCCKGNCGDTCLNYEENFLAWDGLGIGKSLVFLAMQAIFFWIIVIIIDTEVIMNLFYRIRPKVLISAEERSEDVIDEDVNEEKQRILTESESLRPEVNHVVISGLTKYFGDKKAVDDVYLSIPAGECFGLLGVNGAGKTTTFKMLTGDETISGGTAYMNGYNIRTDIHNVQKSIGYCPQFDALIDQMTGEETLYMYARLRGIPEKSIPTVVQDLISALLLDKHKKKLTKDYSGGNKRKLSTAIALIGDPPIVFLDEPTTGMDPVARRMLWQALTKVRESGKTLILTSHSMEECEALCTRMAIMVNGRYRCLGSTQHLKNKFGAGYTLIARVSYPSDGSLPDIQSVQRFVEENFPNSILKDKHQNLVQFQIPKGKLTWAVVFKKLEDNKDALNIEDYSVSQTTLEQVFINFARAQIPPDEEKPGCSKRLRQTCCICCIPEYIVDNGGNHSRTSTHL